MWMFSTVRLVSCNVQRDIITNKTKTNQLNKGQIDLRINYQPSHFCITIRTDIRVTINLDEKYLKNILL